MSVLTLDKIYYGSTEYPRKNDKTKKQQMTLLNAEGEEGETKISTQV